MSQTGPIIKAPVEEELQTRMLRYAAYVIKHRALPQLEDGLKCPQLRIMWAAYCIDGLFGKPFKKCARVVGECFTGDTKVYLMDGSTPTMEELSAKGPEAEFYVISVNPQGNLVAAKASLAREVKKSKALVKITLDNGEVIRATPEHRFMLRDGTWCEAKDLTPEMSLYPLYLSADKIWRNKRSKDYTTAFDPNKAEYVFLHDLADDFNLRHGIYAREDGTHRHHKNFHHFDNNPTNIERLSNKDHMLKHVAQAHVTWSNPESRARRAASMASPKTQAKMKENGRRCWQNQKELMFEGRRGSKAFSESNARKTKKNWTNPEIRKRIQEGMALAASKPEAKERMSRQASANWLLPDFRLAMKSANSKGGTNCWEMHGEKLTEKCRLQHADPDSLLSKKRQKTIAEINRLMATQEGSRLIMRSRAVSQALKLGKARFSIEDFDRVTTYSSWQGLSKWFDSFEDLRSEFSKRLNKNNHKVLKIEWETSDEGVPVYCITVPEFSNFMLASGVCVSNCIGKFHPHGNMGVYGGLVHMSYERHLLYPLIEGQGNFGNSDHDNAAAERYTECRLSEIAGEFFNELEMGTVDMVPNYTNEFKEPVLLPVTFPNILVNGTLGLAVGMRTNIPPHNLEEVIDYTIALIKAKEGETIEPTKYLKGPDFPTGGEFIGWTGYQKLLSTGKGEFYVRAKVEIITDMIGSPKEIHITELPYRVPKSPLVEVIATHIREGKIPGDGLKSIQDRTDRKGMLVVMTLRKGADVEAIMAYLHRHTELQVHYPAQLLVLDGKTPKTLNTHDLLTKWIFFRRSCVERKFKFRERKLQDRLEVVRGYLRALQDTDLVVKLIKAAQNQEQARLALQQQLTLTEAQARAILEMRLARLTRMDATTLTDEKTKLEKDLKLVQALLASSSGRDKEIIADLERVKKKFAKPRLTLVHQKDYVHRGEEDFVPTEGRWVVGLTEHGYLFRLDDKDLKQTNRNTKGYKIPATIKDDVTKQVKLAGPRDLVLLITDKGRCYWVKTYQIPEGKPKHVTSFCNMDPGEIPTALAVVSPERPKDELFLLTERGYVKSLPMADMLKVRPSGKGVLVLRGDKVIKTLTAVVAELQILTKKGRVIAIPRSELKTHGSRGARAMSLKADDAAVSIANRGLQAIIVTSSGFAKVTDSSEIPLQRKGNAGVKALSLDEKAGSLLMLGEAKDEANLIVTTRQGKLFKLKVEDIPEKSRQAKVARMVTLADDDEVVAVELV